MVIINRILNSFVFWGAWIIIPVLAEIIPAFGSVILILKRRHRLHKKGQMKYHPEITILIPVYNSSKTLYGCVKSINDSNYPNHCIRIFLVNNKSRDDSFGEYARCQRDFPDLKMQWLNAEQGKARALNMALYNSEGKYIINLDSDGTLEKNALYNMILRFEADSNLDCMTGAIMTDPEYIKRTKRLSLRILQKLEFMEYAQAFLAGRSYSAEMDSVYTLSGAFSAFRKSAVLTSWMYNTETVSEDTHITFQLRYIGKEKIDVCEDAIFLVDPIDNVDHLYTQRQRWQRGSLEVAQMFMQKDKLKPHRMFKDTNVRTLLYDHTFAFPRLIWYLAMLCLQAMRYSPKVIFYSVLIIFALYILVAYLYFFTAEHFLRLNTDLRNYYRKHWMYVALLPLYNLAMFFVRFAGIINSISTDSQWKTRTLSEEWGDFLAAAGSYLQKPIQLRNRITKFLNREEE